MYLLGLCLMKTKIPNQNLSSLSVSSPSGSFPSGSEPRFQVKNCPWLVGTIHWWSQCGVTVRFKCPNTPWGDNNEPQDVALVGNYSNNIQVSLFTEVIPL